MQHFVSIYHILYTAYCPLKLCDAKPSFERWHVCATAILSCHGHLDYIILHSLALHQLNMLFSHNLNKQVACFEDGI